MLVSWEWVLILAVLMAVLFAAGRALIGGRGWRRLFHAALGIGALFAAQTFLGNVTVNLVTLAVSGVLGVPGAVLSVVLTLL